MTARHRRRLTLPVSAAAVLCWGVLSSISVPAAQGAMPAGRSASAQHVLSAAIAAATKEGSVRITVHFFSGTTTGEVVEDSATSSGVQTVAIGKQRISIVLVHGIAYFTGNSQGLTSYFGLPTSLASTMAGRWISVTATDAGYQSVVSGLTLASALKEVTPTGAIVDGKRSKVDGLATMSIVGAGSGGTSHVTLFIAARGKPLPLEAATSGGSGKSETGEIVTFTRWGEKVRAPQPTSAIPISALKAPAATGG